MRALHVVPAAILLVLSSTGAVLAHERGERDEERGRRREPGEHRARHGRAGSAAPDASPEAALYRKECGACHLAYPPGMLPAASWRRTLAGLEHHFGENAELDEGTLAALDRWLAGRAAEGGASGRSGRGPGSADGEAPLRITETPWFRREHREVDGRTLARPSIRTFARCGACHPGAAEWDFEEDRVIIPSR